MPRCVSTSSPAPKVASSTGAVSTSAGGPAAITRRLRHTRWGRCAAMPLRSWVVSTIEMPDSLRSPSRCSTACRVVMSTPEVGSSSSSSSGWPVSARARNIRCCWPPESSRMCRPARSAMPRRSRDAITSARSAAVAPEPRPALRAAHQHALEDRHREVPVDGLQLRARRPRAGRAGARGCPATGPARAPRAGRGDRAHQHAQQRGLAGARGPDDPGELPRLDRQVDVGQDRATLLVGDARGREVRSRASLIAGTSRCPGRRRDTSRALRAGACPPRPSMIVT